VFDKLVESSGSRRAQPAGHQRASCAARILTDATGNPVTGVQFAVLQAGVSEEIRTDATTDADGTFYAFLPADSKGSWWVEYVAISCESNVMMRHAPTDGQPEPRDVCATAGGAYSPVKFEVAVILADTDVAI